MKFRSEQGILAEALGALSRVASTRNAGTPVLAGVKMILTGDLLVLSSTDNEVAIQFQIAVGGDTDGQALVSAQTLNEIVRVMPQGKITFEVAGEAATVSAARSQFTIPTLNAVEFPRMIPPAGDPLVLPTQVLKTALAQVVRAASTEQSRQHLNSVLVTSAEEGIRLVVTDGYRLAIRTIAGASTGSIDNCIVPRRAFAELQRLLDLADEVSIRINETEVAFQTPSMTLSSRLINVDYPPYLGIIPKDSTNEMVVNREETLDALRRTGVLATTTIPVRIYMSADGARLTVTLPDGSTSVEDIDARYTGEDLTIAFNADYLAQGIDACPTEEVSISTSTAARPAVIRPVGDESFLYILMPQRV